MSKYRKYKDLLRDIPLFPDIFTNGITRSLAHPKKNFMGLYTRRTMQKYNNVMIKNAVKLCQIQAHHAILEVGFGPGLGLQEALKYLTDPRGKLFGLDVSEYMHKVARERLGPQLALGRVHLLQGRVECIPLPDHCIHGVFHANCHLYWPDMATATAELLRVMRPGARMLATCDLGFLRQGVDKGFFKGMTVEPEPYLQALRAVGFLGVSMEDLTDEGKSFQVIYATSPPPSTTETQTSVPAAHAPEAIALCSRLLEYTPTARFTPLEACAHTFFDELRDPNLKLPNGREKPLLFNFSTHELSSNPSLASILIPAHARNQPGASTPTNASAPSDANSGDRGQTTNAASASNAST